MFGTLSAGVTIFSTLGSLAKGIGKPGWNKRAGMSKSDWEWEVTLYYFSAVMVMILCALKKIETGMVTIKRLNWLCLNLLFKHDVRFFVCSLEFIHLPYVPGLNSNSKINKTESAPPSKNGDLYVTKC